MPRKVRAHSEGYRSAMHVIGTAGHVDHGKSKLVERLTGTDPDRFEEEKRRGLTIDLGFAWFELPSGQEIGIIDVPGHERFIKNMLAGAGGISICLFVVAANEGLRPQSIEHLAIIDLLGIDAGVIALSKSDTVDSETLEVAAAEVSEHLSLTSLKGAPIVPCSAITGAGMDELVATLGEVVDRTPPAEDLDRPRMWVDRVFSISGAGTVVTGTLTGGTLHAGDAVEVAPEKRSARIRALQSHKREVDQVPPGNRTAINLAGLDREGAARGDAIVTRGRWRPTRLVDARIRVLPDPVAGDHHVLTDKGAHLLYVGSAETPVRVKLLGRDRLASGGVGLAQLYLRDPLPLFRGDRFVLRDAGRVLTFGGGEVLDPVAEPTTRQDPKRVALLERLVVATDREALEALLESEGAIPLADALFRSGAGSAGDAAVLGDLAVSVERLRALSEQITTTLRDYHRKHPLEAGMPRELLRAGLGLDPAPFDDLLTRAHEVEVNGARVRLASFSVKLDPQQRQRRAQVIETIERAGFAPPTHRELGLSEDFARSLEESGDLVRIGDFYLTASQAGRARELVRATIESVGPLTVAQVRDLLGTSRKYAVPLCEWLDSTGATRRRGDQRTLGPTA